MLNGLFDTERGQASIAVTIIVALAVVALIGGVLIPIGLNAINEDETTTQTQDVGTTYDIGPFESNVTATTSGSDATVELTYENTTTSKTISVGTTSTYTFDGDDVDVTVDSATSSQATVNYSYANDFGYSGGASSIWGILDLIVVLAVFMFIVGLGLSARGRV